MNLFLLTAVPLAAIVFHRLFFPGRKAFSEPQAWIGGLVWSLLALMAASFLGKLKEFDGNLGSVFLGLGLEALLVPGAVTAAWFFTRKTKDLWVLGLWLVMAFTLAGVRDFAATSRIYEIHELFLVPLARLMVILLLPVSFALTLRQPPQVRALGWALVAAVVWAGPLLQVLWFAGWGWLAGVLEVALLATGLFLQKKAASPLPKEEESGTPLDGTEPTSEGRRERP